MSEETKIQWTDSTVNFWSGCTKVSTGCKNCYAEKMDNRHLIEPVSHWGKGAPRLKGVGAVKMALALNRKPWACGCEGKDGSTSLEPAASHCSVCGVEFHRRRVFSLSRGDWLDEEAPIEWLAEMLDTIRRCENLDWLLVTKRPELFFDRLHDALAHVEKITGDWPDRDPETELGRFINDWIGLNPPKHVMVLTSVEDQEAADTRIPELLKIPAARRGLSCEPLLGPVDLDFFENGAESEEEKPWAKPTQAGCLIDWVIVGGESGTGARQCYLDWIRSIQSQCKAASIPCFVKQLGANAGVECLNQSRQPYFSQIDYGKKGDEFSAWPADLQVREFYK